MSFSHTENQYIDLKNNGRLFPTWILHNFKKYKLPKVIRAAGEDPCKTIKSNSEEKIKLRQYQEFMGAYLDPHGPYNEILLYHGLGSGKTATSVNMLNIMYNYDHNINVIILIKASLRDDPWMTDLQRFIHRDPSEEKEDLRNVGAFKNIHFVHYDSPFADKGFTDLMKTIDTTKRTMFIIDEAHNFIRNVYSNTSSKSSGKRAQIIYDEIVKNRAEYKDNKLVLISATPGINTPYELALLFNMLRPGCLPSSETEFNRLFVTESSYPILNPLMRNLFQRRIMGLVSYYIGSTPDLFAREEREEVNLQMSPYQYHIYRVFEDIEAKLDANARKFRRTSQLYRTYTRQASNFVFPFVNGRINGETRPRPNAFRISEKLALEVQKGSQTDTSTTKISEEEIDFMKKYVQALNSFLDETEGYFKKIHQSDVQKNHTIFDDLDDYVKGFGNVYKGKFKLFYEAKAKRSELFDEMYKSSPKVLAIVFTSAASPGKVMIYSNYVVMEGIDVLKMYFRLIGFNDYSKSKDYMGYCEYHGRMDKEERKRVKRNFNMPDNIRGQKCKVILLSPSATEGIQLLEIRQEHILEPYFTEVRIAQVIGRGLRLCSHVNLPMEERVVNIYRYKVVKPDDMRDNGDTVRSSTDEIIEDIAMAKDSLIQSFLSAMKEVATDCELFREHNMMSQSYPCFKFPENTILAEHIGPAFKEDIKDDMKYDSGLNARKTRVEKIKVIRINAVHHLDSDEETFSKPDKYWYYAPSGMVYDYETHYPVGHIQLEDNIPPKLDKDTYIITHTVKIPSISPTMNL